MIPSDMTDKKGKPFCTELVGGNYGRPGKYFDNTLSLRPCKNKVSAKNKHGEWKCKRHLT